MYSHKIAQLSPSPAELDCSSTNTQYFVLPQGGQLTRIAAMVSTVMSSTAPTVITVVMRPTHASTVGEVTIGTLSIPNTQAVAGVLYKDIESKLLLPGQEIVYKVTTAASTSGKVIPLFDLQESPEVAGNVPNMIVSA